MQKLTSKIAWILNKCRLAEAHVFLALLYISRILKAGVIDPFKFDSTDTVEFTSRFLVMGFMLADKWLRDEEVQTSYWFVMRFLPAIFTDIGSQGRP